MKQAALNDPPVASWEPAFRDLAIHVMMVLGDDDKKTLSVATAKLIEELRPLTINDGFVRERIRVEHGNAIRNANGDGLEHFGNVDGVSQPLFSKDENDRAKFGAVPTIGDALQWDPFEPLALVLVPDLGSAVSDACGRYFVFRKLEQRVRDFKQAEDRLAKALGLSEVDKERAGAMAVGRFEDGTPLTLDDEDGMISSGDANNFSYENDRAGLRCPFHAHIRKTNPRGSGGGRAVGQKVSPSTSPESWHGGASRSEIAKSRQRSTASPSSFPRGTSACCS